MKALALASLLALAAAVPAAQPGTAGGRCEQTSTGLTPLSDLANGTYKGFRGGLYPAGRNAPSATYLARGRAYLTQVKPRRPDGAADPNGRIVLLSVGMSNTTQEYSDFKALADADPAKSPRVAVVDGAQGGQDAETIKDPASPFWTVIDRRLAVAGATRLQVQVAWLKEAIARPTEPFPTSAQRLQADLRQIVANMRQLYPNLRLVFLSSRTYGGYAATTLNPEPYAYESGFAVKWLVTQRVEGKLTGAWLGWGPYLWTDGTKGRRDGLVWTCDDTRDDGTHPSPSGQQKVAALLLAFFKTNALARPWFVAS